MGKFRLALRRKNVSLIGVTSPIADLAHELREYYATPRLGTPDAIHLATAIVGGCVDFFTFDGADEKKSPKVCKLLPLGPSLAQKYNLPTERPRRPPTSQGVLALGPHTPPPESS